MVTIVFDRSVIKMIAGAGLCAAAVALSPPAAAVPLLTGGTNCLEDQAGGFAPGGGAPAGAGGAGGAAAGAGGAGAACAETVQSAGIVPAALPGPVPVGAPIPVGGLPIPVAAPLPVAATPPAWCTAPDWCTRPDWCTHCHSGGCPGRSGTAHRDGRRRKGQGRDEHSTAHGRWRDAGSAAPARPDGLTPHLQFPPTARSSNHMASVQSAFGVGRCVRFFNAMRVLDATVVLPRPRGKTTTVLQSSRSEPNKARRKSFSHRLVDIDTRVANSPLEGLNHDPGAENAHSASFGHVPRRAGPQPIPER